jgi:hypothetical protein
MEHIFCLILRLIVTAQIDKRIAIVLFVVTVTGGAFGQITPTFVCRVYHCPSCY